MPTYSYACTDCGNRFDVVQAFSDDALTTCAKCSGRLRKLFGSVGVVFKGSGFYRTDNRESRDGHKGSSNGSNGHSKPDTGPADKSSSSEKTATGDSSSSGSNGKSASSDKPTAAATTSS